METLVGFSIAAVAFLGMLLWHYNRRASVASGFVAIAALVASVMFFTGGGGSLSNNAVTSEVGEYSTETGYTVAEIASSPDGTILFQGYVRDRETGDGLPDAFVSVIRYRHPDYQPQVAAITNLSQAIRTTTSDSPIGRSRLEVLTTNADGFYRIEVERNEQIELYTTAAGYWEQDTPIFLAEGSRQVEIFMASLDQPAPLPSSQASYVIDEGFTNAQTGQALSATNALKERAAAGLRCQGIDVQASDITDIVEIAQFTEVVKTNVLLRSDDCSSKEARTVDYSKAPTDAKVVTVAGKGKFTLLDDCVNLAIPTPEGRLQIIKWEDTDGDGDREQGEGPPPANVTFKFQIVGEGKDFLVTTDENGLFVSDELPPGTYTVTEVEIPDGWEPTTPVTQTVEVKDGELATAEFGNREIPPPPPPVTIVGEKVWVHGDIYRVPDEVFTFELSGPGLATLQVQTDVADGKFRFESVDLFANTDADEIQVTIEEILPSARWQPIDPLYGKKVITISRGETWVDAGIWKNRTVKPPGPSPTPFVTPTPTPTPSPTPTPTPSPTPTQSPQLIFGCPDFLEHGSELFTRVGIVVANRPVTWSVTGADVLSSTDTSLVLQADEGAHVVVMAKAKEFDSGWIEACNKLVPVSVPGVTPVPSNTPAPTPPPPTGPTPTPQWTPPPP